MRAAFDVPPRNRKRKRGRGGMENWMQRKNVVMRKQSIVLITLRETPGICKILKNRGMIVLIILQRIRRFLVLEATGGRTEMIMGAWDGEGRSMQRRGCGRRNDLGVGRKVR